MLTIGPVEGKKLIDRVPIGKPLAIAQGRGIDQRLEAAADQVQVRGKVIWSSQDVADLSWVQDFPVNGQLLQLGSQAIQLPRIRERKRRVNRRREQGQDQQTIELEHFHTSLSCRTAWESRNLGGSSAPGL
jgi:hypothetical protein